MPILRKIWQWGQGLPPHDEIRNYAQVLIAGKDGIVFAEIEPDIKGVAWRLNEESSISLSIAHNDAKATETVLQFGNRILIQFDNGLPDWGGVIDPPRNWQPNGAIDFNAFSAEHILSWRQTPQELIFEDAPAGTIFRELLRYANILYDTGIGVGEIYEDGPRLQFEFHYTNILDIIRDQLVDNQYTSFDFDVAASLVNGKITFTANFYEQKGIDKTNAVQFLEGQNIVDATFTQNGTILNSFDIIGRGSNWEDDRPTSHHEDTDSIALYDYRQTSEIFSEASEPSTLNNIGVTKLDYHKTPKNRVCLKAVDKLPARFSTYQTGDIVSISLENFGFNGYEADIRVWTREYDLKGGFCNLMVEEII